MLAPVSCALTSRWELDPWATDYQSAEHRARKSGQAVLIVYKVGRADRDRQLDLTLKDSDVKARAAAFVRCTLYRTNEPDRRYADQFDVRQAPALILLFADDTYHVHTGQPTPTEVSRFLAEAAQPGTRLMRNPHIPRDVKYRWYLTLDGAREAAQSSGSSMLAAYHRVGTGDWRKLNSLLDRPEVFRRFAAMVHCQVACLNPLVQTLETPWGDLELPALVIVHPDGSYGSLELPNSAESVVQFAARYGEPPVLPTNAALPVGMP